MEKEPKWEKQTITSADVGKLEDILLPIPYQGTVVYYEEPGRERLKLAIYVNGKWEDVDKTPNER